MNGTDFIAIDFETATGKRASVCEAGICVVRDGKIAETKSWLVRPEDNEYCYWNIQIHGIRPAQTASAPDFPTVWKEIAEYLAVCPVLVAHNAVFDMGCIRRSMELYDIEKPAVTFYCSLRAARHVYAFSCNTLDYLCDKFKIAYGNHHRAGDDAEMCARLFLREIQDTGQRDLCGMDFCKGEL